MRESVRQIPGKYLWFMGVCDRVGGVLQRLTLIKQKHFNGSCERHVLNESELYVTKSPLVTEVILV